MRRAIPIEQVRAYVEHQLAQAEATYEHVRGGTLTPDPRNPEWSTIWTRYVWLYFLEKKALSRAERAGVGAVLALDLDETLLEQLALLGEQLHMQQTTGPTSTGVRDSTAYRVISPRTRSSRIGPPRPRCPRPPRAGAGARTRRRSRAGFAKSASASGRKSIGSVSPATRPNTARPRVARLKGVVGFRWHPGLALRRRPIVTAQDIELALHRLLDRFGGPSRPLPGFEAVHRHTRDAAGSLRNWRVLRALEETDARDLRDQLELAREAAHAAVEAARVAGADTAADLAQIAADIDELYQRQTGEKSHD
ncbi:MAG: hypothetical protein U5K73_04670 [Halofilum sp. (in: g-proteobacteria)]|nr:hypothetical protein [Halofilum sp. (in: g-proteobacteria)]